MAGFGTELLLFCGLGYVVLGPQRMHAILQHIARMKAEFEKTRQELNSQLATPTVLSSSARSEAKSRGARPELVEGTCISPAPPAGVETRDL